MILKTDLWPVQTDLEIFRPIYFASNVILSVRKNAHSGHICNEICRNDNSCGVLFHDRSKHSHVLIHYPVITHVSSH